MFLQIKRVFMQPPTEELMILGACFLKCFQQHDLPSVISTRIEIGDMKLLPFFKFQGSAI